MARTWPLPALALVLAFAAPAAAEGEPAVDPSQVVEAWYGLYDHFESPGITVGVEGPSTLPFGLHEHELREYMGGGPRASGMTCVLEICMSPELCSGMSGGQTFKADVTTPVVYLSVYGAYAGYSENC